VGSGEGNVIRERQRKGRTWDEPWFWADDASFVIMYMETREALHMYVTLRRLGAAILVVERNKYYLFWVCICSLMQHSKRMRHLWPVCLYQIFHIVSQTTWFPKENLNTKCAFWFSLQRLSETFLILSRIQWNINIMCTGLHVKYPIFLSDFSGSWKVSKYF